MPAVLEVQLKLDGPLAVTKRDIREASREAMAEVGRTHHRLFKPRKFGPNAQQIYRLRFRSTRYRQAKRGRGVNGQGVRAIGVDRPFIWSGTTRDLAMGAEKYKAKAPSAARAYVDVVINAPVLNFQPWLREEMEKVTKGEAKKLGIVARKRFAREIEQTRRSNTVRV